MSKCLFKKNYSTLLLLKATFPFKKINILIKYKTYMNHTFILNKVYLFNINMFERIKQNQI